MGNDLRRSADSAFYLRQLAVIDPRTQAQLYERESALLPVLANELAEPARRMHLLVLDHMRQPYHELG
jgi:hypothetical protein